jgi:hypothetical protein
MQDTTTPHTVAASAPHTHRGAVQLLLVVAARAAVILLRLKLGRGDARCCAARALLICAQAAGHPCGLKHL